MNLSTHKFKLRIAETYLKTKPPKNSFLWDTISKKMSVADETELTLQELLESVTSGNVFQLGELYHEHTPDEKRELKELYREDTQEYERYLAKINNRKYTLKTADIIAIDVDNDAGNVQPMDVIDFIKPSAVYYTFSHQTISEHSKAIQSSYRLLFALSEPCDADMLEFISKNISAKIIKKYPHILAYKGEVEPTLKKKMILGSRNKNYMIFDNVIDVDPYKDKYRFVRELDELQAISKLTTTANTIKDSELLDMAKFLNKKGVSLDFGAWTTLAIGVWQSAQEGQYSEDLALEMLKTFDGYQQSDAFYKGYKRENNTTKPATIATFIKLAMDNGYKRTHVDKFFTPADIEPKIETQEIEIDTHIDTSIMYEMLTNDIKNILIDSPTGSGKTTSVINAAKQYLNLHPDAYIYIAVPTKALATQVAEKHNLGQPLIDRISVFDVMNKNLAKTRKRLFVGSYDKSNKFINQVPVKNGAIIIADEVHKEVIDYGYRRDAITSLFNLREDDRVLKFIGLSGTTQEIDLAKYDKRYIISKRDNKPIFDEFITVPYHHSKSFTEIVTNMIASEIKRGNKVLAFVNNKSVIETISRTLSKQDYKVSTITSDTANLSKSVHYRKLLHNEKFPDADALIATNVISDGINIMNESENYTCIIAPHFKSSPIYNASAIKQATNRFRNPYKRVVMPIFIPVDDKGNEDEERAKMLNSFGLDANYNDLLSQAVRFSEMLRKRFSDSIDMYQPDLLERVNGLMSRNYYITNPKRFNFKIALENERMMHEGYKNYDKELVKQLEDIRQSLFNVDERLIRKRASVNQERYYKYFYNAFTAQISKVLNADEKRISFDNFENLSYEEGENIKSHLEYLAKISTELEKVKEDNLKRVLTPDFYWDLYCQAGYDSFIDDTTATWKELQDYLTKKHYRTLKDIIFFVDNADDAITIIEKSKSDRNVHQFKKSLDAIKNIGNFNKADKSTGTHNVVRLLQEALIHQGAKNKKEIDAILTTIAKELKIKNIGKREITTVYNQYFRFDNKHTKHGNYRDAHRLISLDTIAAEFGLQNERIRRIYNEYLHIN